MNKQENRNMLKSLIYFSVGNEIQYCGRKSSCFCSFFTFDRNQDENEIFFSSGHFSNSIM